MESEKKHFIHLLKVITVCLVIFSQTLIAYSAPENWFCFTPTPIAGWLSMLTNITNIVVHTFLIAVLFAMLGSMSFNLYEENGAVFFMKTTIKKYGTAIIFYLLFVHPVIFLIGSMLKNQSETTLFGFENYMRSLSSGPFPFLITALAFNIGYAVCKKWFVKNIPAIDEVRKQSPQLRSVFFVIIVGVLSFILRIFMPVSNFSALMQTGFLPLYIGMFVSGLIAARNSWIESLKIDFSIPWAIFTLLCLPPLVLSIYYSGGMTEFAGGFTSQSLFISLWEPMSCMAGCFFFSILFFKYFNNKSKKIRKLSNLVLGVILIHPVPIVFFSILIEPISIPTLLKWFITSILSTVVSFMIASVLHKLQIFKKQE